jgi:hypothetical protein
VWPTLHFAEYWLADPKNRQMFGRWGHGTLTPKDMLDALSMRLRLDLEAAEYVYVDEGIPIASFKRGELVVAPRHSQTDVSYAGYQPSHVEEAIEWVRAHTDAFEFTATNLSKGFFAEMIVGLPADMHMDDFHAFVDQIREKSQGVAKAGQPLFMPLPAGQENRPVVIPLKQPLQEMGFQQFLSVCTAHVATGIYRMHTSTIGARPWDGGSGKSLGQGNMTEEIALAQEEGLQADMQHLIDGILNPLAMRCHPDLRVVAWYGDYDPQREAQLYSQRVNTDMTHNEVRLAQGLKPKGFWMPDEDLEHASEEDRKSFDDNPYNHIASFANMKMQAANQQAMMAAQQGMFGGGAPGGGEGEEGEEGAEEDADDPWASFFGGGDEDEEAEPEEGDEPPPMRKGVAMAPRVRTVRVHLHDTRRRR